MMLTATRMAALALLISVPMAGCAGKSSSTGAPSAMTATTPDVKTLAGKWDGWMKGTSGYTAPVQVTVSPDGTYTSQMGASSGSGTFEVVDGKVLTKGHLSGSAFGAERQSVVTVVDKGGRPVITGEGRNDAGPYSFELTKRN